VDAAADNFPKAGIKVVLPYQEGTNRTDYNFIVSHLAFQNLAGDTGSDLWY
jgi:hypothetical protein